MKVIVSWLAIVVSILVTAKLHGLELRGLFQPVSLVTVYLPVLLYLLINPLNYAYKLGFKRFLKSELSEVDLYFLSKISSVTLLAGVVGMVFGMIRMLGNLSDASALGSGVAAFTMSLLYAILPLLFTTILERKSVIKRNAALLVFTFTLLGGQFFMVLYALSNKS